MGWPVVIVLAIIKGVVDIIKDLLERKKEPPK